MPTTLRGIRRLTALLGALALVLALPGIAFGDGTEMLGDPVGIDIADGSGTVVAGVGLVDGQPGTINVDVPGDVVQALLYWEGQDSSPSAATTDTITVGASSVTGELIGGPTRFFSGAFSSTFRADITDLVSTGPNALEISGLDFTRRNNGAGVLVIYDDGSSAEIAVKDGNDLAFINFASPLDATVPQTFAFAPEAVDRVADLSIFASSVKPDGLRPSTIEITLSDGVVLEIVNVLDSVDGHEWDSLTASISIPAGVDSLTVQLFSDDRSGTGALPASMAWSAAALSVPVTPPSGGGEGCTPGYWKQEHHFDSWSVYSPDDSFSDVFGVDYDKTLLEALEQGGGKEKALGRHAVAALLNSVNPGVSYEYSAAEVIALVQEAYATGDYNGIKGQLEYQNELGCPLN